MSRSSRRASTRDSGRLQHTSSVKDVQALETELAALRKRRDDLEEIELTVMERVEELEAARRRRSTRTRRCSAARVDALEAARGDEKSEARRAARRRSRRTARPSPATIPADLVELYEKQRARYGIGAALLVRGVSMGSNVKLTESDLAVIRRAAPDDVVLCPDSSAILIRNEESGL